MPIDPKEILAKIRAEARPLVNIRTGGPVSADELAQEAPITSKANEAIRDWLEDPKNTAASNIPCSELEKQYVEMAEWSYDLSWKHTQDDAEAFELFRQMIWHLAKDGNEGAAKFLPHLLATDGFNAFGWHAKWYHYGCQSIEVEDKYAASLCATRITPSELEFVRLPWPCFIVRAPKFLQNLNILGEPLRHILVHVVNFTGKAKVSGKQEIEEAFFDADQYRLQLITANKYRILPAMQLASWADPNPAFSYNDISMTEMKYSEIDRRQLEIVGRLVLGAVISMNDPKAHKRYAKSGLAKDRQPGSPRYGTPSQVVLHKIGKPVKVDARETISAYVTGRRGHVTNVRTLVAGHWKNQPHGPRNSLRRWQHVECYWRGDEDAPRIIRPHVVSGEG